MPTEKAQTIAALATPQKAGAMENLIGELQEIHNAAYGLESIGKVLGEDEMPGDIRGGLGDAVKVLGTLIQLRAIDYLDRLGVDPYSHPDEIRAAVERHLQPESGGGTRAQV